MAQIVLQTPDAATHQRIVDAFCAINGYNGPPDQPSRTAFAKQQIIAGIAATVQAFEQSQQAKPAPPVVT